MKNILLTTAVILCMLNIKSFAQDSLNYFPCNVGDKWFYYVDPGDGSIYTKTVTIDSVANDSLGKVVYRSGDSNNRLVIDTSKAIVYSSYFNSLDSTWHLLDLYHLNSNIGAYWNVYEDTSSSNWFGVGAIFDTTVFGERKKVKRFEEFGTFYGDTSGGQDHNPNYWFYYLSEDYAYGIGMTQRQLEGGEGWYLVGAIINGDSLGIILSVKETKNNLPTKFKLYQNYPNPFNGGTTIEYEVPIEAYITLTIYDILGRKVETLFKGKRNAGSYSAVWNPINFSSGIYIYAGLRLINSPGIRPFGKSPLSLFI